MHPYLIEFGDFGLPTYGVLAAVGLLLGLSINTALARRDGANGDKVWDLGIISVACAILGSKLFLLITNPDFRSLDAIFSKAFLQAGGVYYGGLIGGVLGGLLYMKRNGMPMLRVLDSFTPGIAFGHAIGRLGCFAAGCCYGRPTAVPWGVTFMNPQAQEHSGTPLGIALHPTQLYEFSANIAIFVVLMLFWSRKKWDGHVFAMYAFLYGVARFFLEFYRDDPERGSHFDGMLTTTQLVAIGLVVLAGALWMRRSSSQFPTTTQPAASAV